MQTPRARYAVLVASLGGAASACLLAVSTDGLAEGAAEEGGSRWSDATISDASRADDPRDEVEAGDAARDARTFPPEASVWSENGHGYAIYIEPAALTWSEARARAESVGGHLVTLGSAEESAFVSSVFTPRLDAALSGNGVGLWMGGWQALPDASIEPGGGWQWIDGTPWTFTAWRAEQPDDADGAEHYLDIYRLKGIVGWNDDKIGGNSEPLRSYIVEFE